MPRTNESNNCDSCGYKPMVSIITVVYNGKTTLENTILSVINQSYNNLEYIVIDGGSTDGTIDIIKKYESRITYWISESDKGIYDAMNKGLQLVKGNWINFMNSGDRFYSENILSYIFENRYLDGLAYIFGDVEFYTADFSFQFKQRTSSIKLNLNPICHQSIFIKKEFHEPFDLQFKLCADHNLIYTLYRKCRGLYLEGYVISKVLAGGVSYSPYHTRKEKALIAFRNGTFKDCFFVGVFTIYGIFKQLAKSIFMLSPRFLIKMTRLKSKIERY